MNGRLAYGLTSNYSYLPPERYRCLRGYFFEINLINPNFFLLGNKNALFKTSLFDETTFYQQFSTDLDKAQSEVIIESIFITISRINKIATTLEKLVSRAVNVYVIARLADSHEEFMKYQAEESIQ